MQGHFINPEKKLNHFKKVLSGKEKRMNQVLDLAAKGLGNSSVEFDCIESGKIERKLNKNDFVLLHFVHDTLKVWSDKSIQTTRLYSKSQLDNQIVFLGNAWYKTVNRDVGDGHLFTGLILIKHQYVYENKFLHSGFQEDFRIPPCVGLLLNPVEGGEAVLDNNREFLLSLIFNNPPECLKADFNLPAYLYLSGIFLVLLLVRLLYKKLKKKVGSNWLFPFTIIILIGINFFIFYFKFPGQLFELDLFSPYYFAFSSRFSSIGHLLVSALFVFVISYIFYKDINLKSILKNNKRYINLFNVLSMIWGALFFILIVYLFKNLILNSNVNYEPYRILKISYLSLSGYFAIVLLFISLGLYLFKVIREIKDQGMGKSLVLPLALVIVVFFLTWLLIYPQFEVYSVVFYLFLVFAI